MGAWSRTLAVVCPALAVLWACSSDEGNNGGPDVGSAGKGGSGGGGGSAGSTSKGGSAGSTSKGGSAGSTSQSGAGGASESGGEGGSGGEPPAAGPACTACTATACEAEQKACEDSTACSAWLACVAVCEDAACVRQCDADHGDAALLIAAVYECACDSCTTECQGAQVCDQSCSDDSGLEAVNTAPPNLGATGLYVQNGNNGWELSPYVREFQPEYKLFSGAAEKTRWIYLPKCAPIDTANMDHWVFPVGTRLWKEFKIDGKLIETRLMLHYGNTPDDWLMVSYQWPQDLGSNDPIPDPSLALLVEAAGVVDANGTTHNIPSQSECINCHGRLSERVLGFSAIQLSHALPGVKLSDLVDWGVLTDVESNSGATGLSFDPPGDEITQAALGYLHANCGNCHNETGVPTTSVPEQPQAMWLRLLVGHTTVEATHAMTTAVDEMAANGTYPNLRIDPATPLNSVILTRINSDVAGTRMPPMREVIDNVGYSAVLTWIESLQ